MPLDSESLAALRELLPWWGRHGLAPWLAGAAFGASALATALGIRLAGGGVRRLPAEAHWTQRARAAYPARPMAAFGLAVPASALGALLWIQRGPLDAPHAGRWLAALVLASTAGALLAEASLQRWLGTPPRGLGERLRNAGLGLVLVMPQLPVLGATLLFVRPPAEAGDALALLACGLALAATAWGAALPLLRGLGWVRPASERVARLVAEAARRHGVTPPAIEEVAWQHANAFALPLAGRLLITRGACEASSDAELEALLGHELGHLGESRGARAMRLLGQLVLLPVAALPLLHAQWGVAGLAGLAAFLLAALLGLQRLARHLEVRADAVAHAEEAESGSYARALEALHRANHHPAVIGRRLPHPDLYDRMCAAGVAPDYPRPPPPSRTRTLAGVAAVGAVALAGAVGFAIAPFQVPPLLRDATSVELARAHVAATSGRASVMALALALGAEGRHAEALPAARAAVSLQPADPMTHRLHAHLLARAGRCAEAEVASRAAEALVLHAEPWVRAEWSQSRRVWPVDCGPARTAATRPH